MKFSIEEYNGGYALYSIVKTNFGGDAKNFICEGTKEYCESIKEMVQRL